MQKSEPKPTSVEAQITWQDFASEEFAYGDGSEDDPFLIFSAQDLALLAKRVNDKETNFLYADKHYKLAEDIELAQHPWSPIGDYQKSLPFSGSFYGDGYTIYGLNIKTDKGYQGFFGYTNGATIQNVVLKSGAVASTANGVGSLVGVCSKSFIDGCYSNLTVQGAKYVGGMVGYFNEGFAQIAASFYAGYVKGENIVGGIVGFSAGDGDTCTAIKKCIVDAAVEGTEYVGAIIGSHFSEIGLGSVFKPAPGSNAFVENCIARGMIIGSGDIISGANEYTVVTACSFYGAAQNDSLSFGQGLMFNCWAVINERKLISTDLDNVGWTENWIVIDGVNNGLPIQKELFWLGSTINSTPEKILQALFDFEKI